MRQYDRKNEWRKHNSSAKNLLVGLGWTNKTDTSTLKKWLSHRCKHTTSIEGDEFPVKLVYDHMVGAFKTWAEATYQVALIERKKGKKL